MASPSCFGWGINGCGYPGSKQESYTMTILDTGMWMLAAAASASVWVLAALWQQPCLASEAGLC